MKKKTILVSIIIAGLLIGIVSAGLIDYFGRIEQTVEVSGLVFYLDGDMDKLLINGIPDTEEEITIEVNIENSLNEDLIGELDKPKFDIIFWAKADNSGDTLEFKILKDSDIICEPSSVDITATANYTKKTTTCSSTEKTIFESGDEIKLVLSGANGNSGDIYISTGKKRTAGYSRVEVSKT